VILNRLTGKELFLLDDEVLSNCLLFVMATDGNFLKPLRAFKRRRLYANLLKDSVVPLGTGAFLRDGDVADLRRIHSEKSGLVATLITTPFNLSDPAGLCVGLKEPTKLNSEVTDNGEVSCPCPATGTRGVSMDENELYNTMIRSLDSCGWEKVIVNFKTTLPIAHNKLAAVKKWPYFLTENILGFSEGKFVMDDLADFVELIAAER